MWTFLRDAIFVIIYCCYKMIGFAFYIGVALYALYCLFGFIIGIPILIAIFAPFAILGFASEKLEKLYGEQFVSRIGYTLLFIVVSGCCLQLYYDYEKSHSSKPNIASTYQSYTPPTYNQREISPPKINTYGIKPANNVTNSNDNDKIVNDFVTTPQHSEMYKKFNESINDEYKNNINSQNTEIPKVENPERNFPTYTPPSNFKMPSESEIQEYRKSIEESYKKYKESIEPLAIQMSAKIKFQEFHMNITNKLYRQAYDCLSEAFQKKVPFDGWVKGFNTTVSSTPYNITISPESNNENVVLTYELKAVDNPGGTTYYNGTATLINTPLGWKIDRIKNKLQ